MVYDREDLKARPEFTFSHAELQLIFEAAKSDDDKPIVEIINSCPSLGVSALSRLLHTTLYKS